MKAKKKVVGIILTYNCEDLIEDTYKRIPKKLFDKIILVDDASSDDTIKVAKKLGISAFTHEHMGYGGNLKFGLAKASKMNADYMVEIHGDGQFDPSIIPTAVKKISEGYSLLLGSRFIDIKQPLKDKMPMDRYLTNIITSFICRLVLQSNLSEFHNGFHIFSKEFIRDAGLRDTSSGHIYSFEIIVQACYKKLPIGEVPINCNYAGEHTSMGFGETVPYLLEIFSLLGLYLLAKVGLKFWIFKHY